MRLRILLTGSRAVIVCVADWRSMVWSNSALAEEKWWQVFETVGHDISAATTGLLHATIYALDSTTKGFHNIPDVGDLSQLVLQLVRRCHHRARSGHLRFDIMDGFQCAAATAFNGICNLLRELYDALEKNLWVTKKRDWKPLFGC